MSPLALVTGGSRGIGACVVAGLRAAGWDVLAPGRDVLDFSHERRDGYFYRPFPFSRKEDHLDAVVFCHGTWFSRPLADITPNDWHNQFRLRVVEPWLFLEQVCMRALTRAIESPMWSMASPKMKDQLANLLASGQSDQALRLLAPFIGAAATEP